MRHLIYIHLIIIVFSAVCAYYLFYDTAEKANPYIIINEKAISFEAYERELRKKPYYQTDLEFLTHFIEKELIIQKAMKERLHQNTEFSEKIKTFFESNLIQLMMEKKMDEFASVKVSDEIMEKFSLYAQKTVLIKSAEEPFEVLTETPFLFLPDTIKYLLLTGKTKEGLKKYILTDNIADGIPEINPLELKRQAEKMKNQYLWDQWILELKKNADVIILDDSKG
ncbi:hypothetical protein LZ24_02578 [Desulfobotulus alkaliphilus]|uniref:Uncharacterized protein n=1 Tax=Desulfobotulus alkaliphilus TaxID=622671 RepID=A0A562RI38_9BACT|nr:hypothetical protein [Desulfobotulus alkaliphilus]TWI68204.1 hypothetical protein LZ24_02578 [Desulfobotulus alkaliphilus]